MTTKSAKHLNPSDCFRFQTTNALSLSVLSRDNEGICILAFLGDRAEACYFLGNTKLTLLTTRDRDDLFQLLGEDDGYSKISPRYPQSIPYMSGYQKAFCIGFDIQEGEKKT